MTVRAKPERSWETACRHLFRHIDDVRELRRNPIVANFFVGMAAEDSKQDILAIGAIRAAVSAALEDYELEAFAVGQIEQARRRREIVVCHVLAHRPPEVVAAELHLSRRQFYRERRAICERIARALSANRSAPAHHVAVALRPDTMAITQARVLFEACSDERAIQLLEDVARSSEDPLKCIAALCLTAQIYTQQLQADKAAHQLESARRWLWEKAPRFSQSIVDLCKIHIDFANAFFASTGARPQEAKDLTQEVLSAIRKNICADDDVRELYVDALLFAAEEARSSGEVKVYRECVNAAQSLFSGISEQSARQSAQLIRATAALASETASVPVANVYGDSNRMFGVALQMAERAGLVRTAIATAIHLAGNYAFVLNQHEAALRHALPALDIALKSHDPTLIGSVCIDVASIRIATRQFSEALKDLEIAKTQGRLSRENEAGLYFELAKACLGLNDCTRAGAYAMVAYKRAARFHSKRFEAAALRILALAHYRNRENEAARERIADALDIAEERGSRYGRAFTYHASALITGNQEHARRAKALLPSINSIVSYY